jgi:aminopeptidase N
MKATFDIAIQVEPHLHAMSNMPVKSVEKATDSGLVKYEFDTTKRMSSYLVAFVVSEYVKLTQL